MTTTEMFFNHTTQRKIMDSEITKSNHTSFEPLELKIQINSLAELKLLWHRFNVGPIRFTSESTVTIPTEKEADSFGVWKQLDDKLTRLGGRN